MAWNSFTAGQEVISLNHIYLSFYRDKVPKTKKDGLKTMKLEISPQQVTTIVFIRWTELWWPLTHPNPMRIKRRFCCYPSIEECLVTSFTCLIELWLEIYSASHAWPEQKHFSWDERHSTGNSIHSPANPSTNIWSATTIFIISELPITTIIVTRIIGLHQD